MKLTRALRLRRQDLARLTELHRAQFVAAIAPGKPDLAESFIEGTGAEDDDVRGLVYLRAEDGAEALEGFFLDDARAPSKTARLDGGVLFRAGTTEPVLEMSQGSAPEPLAAVLKDLAVTVSGAALKEDPPFAHAKAPPKPKPELDAGTMRLRVVSARRYIESELRKAPERFQLMHAVRPAFATPTPEGMDGFMAGGILWDIDPGPDLERALRVAVDRPGLMRIQLVNEDDPTQAFTAWFFAQNTREPSTFWPSTRTTATDGRVMVGDTITSAGVELARGKIKVAKKNPPPYAKALAKGLAKLGLTFELENLTPVGDGRGYYGSVAWRKCYPDD